MIECCILAGCDYLKNIKGIGIKKSVEYIKKCRDIDGLMKTLKSENKLILANENYEEDFIKAK